MPVRVRLDDRAPAGRAVRPVGGEVFDDVVIVGLESVEIDPRDGRRDHAPIARFSNLVNSRMKASFTMPVGPLRCFAIMSSATPCASVGGAFLSRYMSSR